MTRTAGFSLLEILVLVAIAGFALALLGPLVRPPSARLFARELHALLLTARFSALADNAPVAAVWDPARREVQLRAGTSSLPELCTDGEVRARLAATRYRGLEVVRFFRDGLVWLPTGRGRSCSGGGAFNGTVLVDDGRAPWRLVVSRGGRVRVEAGP